MVLLYTQFLAKECHVVVHLLRGSQVSERGQQRGPDSSGALAVVLFLLHVVFCSVERKHAELREKALQDCALSGNGPELLHVRHCSHGRGLREPLFETAVRVTVLAAQKANVSVRNDHSSNRI